MSAEAQAQELMFRMIDAGLVIEFRHQECFRGTQVTVENQPAAGA